MMQLLMREIRPDEVEQEVTQRDQFNTDTVGLVETLVREALQNSTDSQSKSTTAPVRTAIKVLEAPPASASYWKELLTPLFPHLRACGISLDNLDVETPRLLLIEDFNTTGLLGATDKKDDRNFSDFWRRTGRSHKRGEQGGRWGLGKLVFSSTSKLRTFFGLTIQEEDPKRRPLLMGQAVLKHHCIPGTPPKEYAPHAFFAEALTSGLQVPIADYAEIEAFRAATGIERRDEPGLSIVVPCIHDDTTVEAMLPHVVRNWFFPILTGKLVVELGTVVLNQATFAELAREHGGEDFADGPRVGFITALHSARASAPAVTLRKDWPSVGVEQALDASDLDKLRAGYAAGDLVAVRAPMSLRPQAGASLPTHLDVYLQQSSAAVRGEAFYVRGAITIPGEARRFRGRNCLGALIADDSPVATFLGDAEGPAHTSWSGSAEKVRENWKNPSERLREIRDLLNGFFEAIAVPDQRLDEDALKHLLYVNRAGSSTTARKRKPVITKPEIPPIKRKPMPFRLVERKGGFAIHGNPGGAFPVRLLVKAAYDVSEGDPLRNYSPHDFALDGGDIKVVAEGAKVTARNGHELVIEAEAPAFCVAVTGFDANRDLFVDAEVAG
jgi:hypothetical protein